ncbi:hypothetical protein ABZV80_30380 [Streptomyces sp. NPDC005132]|uniref:hypothetical protein n=1 Tax=Streptomyces sp. NPDC005132 TaxID=3154294 RepID=UPI0033A477AE
MAISTPAQPAAPMTGPAEPAERPPVQAGFGFSQALVLVGFVAAGITLRLSTSMTVRDIVVMIGSLGMVGASVLLVATARTSTRFLKRLIKALAASGSGS